jgi:hypothetical protein
MKNVGKQFREENETHNYRNQSNMDIQSLIDMCSKKLEQDPNHKKALLLRASSYIKKNELDKVIY